VNPGGEPERDDTGLPPVDIEIPDDARELDRDVQAYFRELRAERRSQRRRRLHVGLTRDGVILPLLACCLILALITGTLLTVFTATSDQNLGTLPPAGANPNKSSQPPTTSPSASPSASSGVAGPRLTQTTAQLSNAHLMLDDKSVSLLPAFLGVMLVLIPPHCQCTTAVSRLAAIGSTFAGAMLVATKGTITEAQRYRAGLRPRFAITVGVAIDSQGALQKAVPAKGLTAVVISPTATAGGAQRVAYANDVTSSDLSSANSPLSVALASGLQAATNG
jgi:hypothetical protein